MSIDIFGPVIGIQQSVNVCAVSFTGEVIPITTLAAANEMLEALVMIESCLSPQDNDVAARKVRAAIAKAQGSALEDQE